MILKRVSLTRSLVKAKSGKRYVYWKLRWFGTDGKQHGPNIGRADGSRKLSKHQAEVLRRRKELELNEHPERRDVIRSPKLGDFVKSYLASRKPEVTKETLLNYRKTGDYLLAFWGVDCRISQITRSIAREFKTALANGELVHINKRHRMPGPVTVERVAKEARSIFNQALDDGLILINPFAKLVRKVDVEKDWHYVDLDETNRLLDACPNNDWRMLLALCRFAGLRQGEALALKWNNVRWDENCLRVWATKTKMRVVPVVPELYPLLQDAYEQAPVGEVMVVSGISKSNLWRDFQVICKRAGVKLYEKWCHTLRKNREQDWAQKFPNHIVAEWMGHSPEVARTHYLKVDDLNMQAATQTKIEPVLAQKLAQKGKNSVVDKKEKIVYTDRIGR